MYVSPSAFYLSEERLTAPGNRRKGSRMKWLAMAIAVILAFGLTANVATAGNTAQHTVTVRVLESTQLAPSRINTNITLPNVATSADSSPTTQTDSSTSLSWASNVPSGHTSKITAQLATTRMPGIMYEAALAKPTYSNGTSTNEQILGTDAVDMLTGIGNENCTGATITYTAFLSEMSALRTRETVTVIWTIIDAGGSDQGGSHYLGRHYYIWEDSY